VPAGDTVLVACSGGADSVALAVAALFVARRMGVRCGLVTVDHRLQDGSGERAAELADWALARGFLPVQVRTVRVGDAGGPEAAAREARYAALEAAAVEHRAAMVLLGHTRDDQAETVLLALARGAGPRGLAGMPVRRGILLRPLLDVARADTRKACVALGLVPWDDPHNVDPSYARARVRSDALPALVAALGPAVVDNLARSAPMIAADNEALDALASAALGEATALDVAEIGGLHTAVRRRVLHLWARRLGAPGSALSHKHVEALDALVMQWRGQGPVHLPGGILAARNRGVLVRVSE
jgi:tRNA(Ile)-lysidine synthase